jgi:hypothetical protein
MLADQRKEEFPKIFSTSKRMHVLKGSLRNSAKNSPTPTLSTIVVKVASNPNSNSWIQRKTKQSSKKERKGVREID